MSTIEDLRELQEEYASASADRRRTIRQQLDIEAGRHPATKMPLADNGETCGSCGNSEPVNYHTRRYWKCRLMPDTRGPGSDIRLKWPACTQWVPSPDSTGGMTIEELMG